LLLCVAKLGRFYGSTGGVGFGVEKEENTLAFEIREGDKRIFVGFETEAGGFGAGFQHGFPRVRYWKSIKI
jgi:hypothetical protein